MKGLKPKPPKKPSKQDRIDELERQVADLSAKLDKAIRRIPNANAPTGGLRPVCHSHTRIC